MKSLIRSFFINGLSLWLVGQVLPQGVSFLKGYETISLAALVLSLTNLLIRPLINILLLPINLLTLGTFRWVVNVATLFLVTQIVPEFKVSAFYFPGFSSWGVIIPPVNLNIFFAYVVTSLLLSLVTSFFFWLVK